jgi:hypothetical protein
MVSPMNHIGQIVMHHRTQTNGGRQQTNIQITSPKIGQRVGGLPPAAIDIVREEIAEVFRDKHGVSMVPGGNHIRDLMTANLTITHTHRELGYPNSQSFRVTKVRVRLNT